MLRHPNRPRRSKSHWTAHSRNVWSNLADEQWVQVTVKDTGVGIDDAALEGIFQPFHTSKTKGMGMGLSICRSIVQAHGGRIWAERGSERGAKFHVLLPLDSDLPS
jgi:two-component system sensor kinase FixL